MHFNCVPLKAIIQNLKPCKLISKFIFIFVILQLWLESRLPVQLQYFLFLFYFIGKWKINSFYFLLLQMWHNQPMIYDYLLLLIIPSFIFQWMELFPEFCPFLIHSYKWSHILYSDILFSFWTSNIWIFFHSY